MLAVGERISRCVMVTRRSPEGSRTTPGCSRRIARERDEPLAVGATVVAPGEIAVGDRWTPPRARPS